MAVQISKKRKFVADGIFKAELNEFLTRELAEDGYSGVEVRVTPTRTEIIILATRTQNVLGEKGRRIRELTAVVQKRFGFPEGSVELYAEKVATRGLCAIAQAESLRYKLLGGLAVRRACYGVLRFIMESGAKGCEVVVSGKLRGQRAKSMKFVDGLMIHSGDPVNYYVDTAVRHVLLRQGLLSTPMPPMHRFARILGRFKYNFYDFVIGVEIEIISSARPSFGFGSTAYPSLNYCQKIVYICYVDTPRYCIWSALMPWMQRF
uniref:Small ribosomal subunit protein uS3 n=1 Tax=Leptobrachium leishanense TaxID=445787 RepID=A0A8C5MBH6_9ANUR